MTTRYRTVDTPIGELLLAGDGDHLTAVHLPTHRTGAAPQPGWRPADDAVLHAAADQLRAYFAGELREFDLPLAAVGTPFQQVVWSALREIPYGGTSTYGQIAARIGQPTASRAVGTANGRNPIAIVVPCHRVIGADGTLTGYAGGLAAKQRLLALEAGALAAF